MRPVSERWEPTIRGSHPMVVRAVLCTTYQTGPDPVGTDLAVLDGSVTVDGSADLRSALTLTVDGRRLWPRRPTDLYAPYGNEVWVARGVQYSPGDVELVGLGYHRIRSATQDDAPDGPVRLECEDRMAAVRDARLLAPRVFLPGTTRGGALAELVSEVYPSVVVTWDDVAARDAVLVRAVVVEDDRLGFCDDLVRSAGKVWYFDGTGTLTVRSLPDPTTPTFTLDHGTNGVLVSMSRTLTRDRTYNVVVASGEGGDTTNPVSGTAVDDNPDSPTYWLGRFGMVPTFYTSPFLVTNAQAAAAAQAVLRRQLGLPYVVSFGSVPNPALEPYDVVRVRYGTDDAPEVHVLDQLVVPLLEDAPMTGTTKEQTTALRTLPGVLT